ncbi:MAG: hypothetical protein ACJ8KX_02880, partial [Chthoniobacterales bacterium]
PGATTTYWTNDGTLVAGVPTNAVTLTVTNGLYSVLLGDTAVTNMTIVPLAVFTNSDVRLRVWFNDGTHGEQLLSPDHLVEDLARHLHRQRTPGRERIIDESLVRPHRGGWQAFESPAVEPYYIGPNAFQSERLTSDDCSRFAPALWQLSRAAHLCGNRERSACIPSCENHDLFAARQARHRGEFAFHG